MKINDGGSAFPVVHAIVPQPGSFTQTPEDQPGMSLRDWFAGMAVIGSMAHGLKPWMDLHMDGEHDGAMFWQESIAASSYQIADEMMKAREKDETP